MSTPQSERERLIEFFGSLGFKLYEFKDSVFREEKSTWAFQTDHKNHTVDCSTILLEDAQKIYSKIHKTNTEIAFGRRCSKGHLMPLEASQCRECMKAYNHKRTAKLAALTPKTTSLQLATLKDCVCGNSEPIKPGGRCCKNCGGFITSTIEGDPRPVKVTRRNA